MIDLLNEYMSLEETRNIALRNRETTNLTYEDGLEVYNVLKTAKLDIKEINDIIYSVPEILSSDLTEVQAMIRFLYKICKDDSKFIIEAYPELLLKSVSSLQEFMKDKNGALEDIIDGLLKNS